MAYAVTYNGSYKTTFLHHFCPFNAMFQHISPFLNRFPVSVIFAPYDFRRWVFVSPGIPRGFLLLIRCSIAGWGWSSPPWRSVRLAPRVFACWRFLRLRWCSSLRCAGLAPPRACGWASGALRFASVAIRRRPPALAVALPWGAQAPPPCSLAPSRRRRLELSLYFNGLFIDIFYMPIFNTPFIVYLHIILYICYEHLNFVI